MAKQRREFSITGQVTEKESGEGIVGLMVEALDKDIFFDDRLGSTLTDKDGRFSITYRRSDFNEFFLDPEPDIYLRVRGSGDRVLYTTENKIRYNAGRSEAFNIEISKDLIEEPNVMQTSNYKVTGKIDPKQLEDIPEKANLTAYVMRDRKLLGSAPVQEDGTFSVEYAYEVYSEEDKIQPLGVQLTFAPIVPDDSIVNEKFKKSFLPSGDFKSEGEMFYAEASKAVIESAFEREFIIDWFRKICITRDPCVQVLTCSSIESGVCYHEKDLANARVRIHEVRQSLLLGPWPTPNPPYTVLVDEGDTDSSGRYWAEWTICHYRYIFPFYITLGYRVEVGQIIDGAFQQIYMDPEDELRDLPNGVCSEVYIPETDVIQPTDPEGELTGSTFKLTRIGNIPVGYIEQNAASDFYGFANSSSATDSATLKVTDSAIGRTIKLFANIGAGLLSGSNEMRYYRLKYSYESDGTTYENYFTIPFRNLREATDAEKPITGPYVTENLGPIVGPDSQRNVYEYPNPYDLTVDKQWVYKGLIMVINTRSLPLTHGRFTITIEPLKADMSELTSEITNPQDLSFTMMVDNTAPTVSIDNIGGPYGSTVACGFLDLDFNSNYTACDGHTRKQLTGTVTVPYSVNDNQGNLWKLRVFADYGDVCDRRLNMQTVDYTDTTIVPVSQRPSWSGGSFTASSTGKNSTTDVNGNPIPGSQLNTWDQCAYQFTVRVSKRVSNGEHAYYAWDFEKHITLKDKASTP